MTFGVKSLRISSDAIALDTDHRTHYRWRRDEVDAVLYVRPSWNPWRYYTVRLRDGSQPDVYFGASSTLIPRWEELGWSVEVQQRWSPRLWWPFAKAPRP